MGRPRRQNERLYNDKPGRYLGLSGALRYCDIPPPLSKIQNCKVFWLGRRADSVLLGMTWIYERFKELPISDSPTVHQLSHEHSLYNIRFKRYIRSRGSSCLLV